MFFSRNINYFIKVIETGSIPEAAKTLFITPSAIRNSLSELERNYGKKLVIKNKKGVCPTEAGKNLYDRLLPSYCSILDLMNEIGMAKKCKKDLKIHLEGFYYPGISKKISNAMDHFKKNIFLSQSCSPYLEDLNDNKCDISISSSLEPDDDLPEHLLKIPIVQEEIGILLSRDLSNKYKSLNEIIDSTKIIQQNLFTSSKSFLYLKNKIENEGISAQFVGMPDFADVLSLVQNGTGISLMTKSILNHFPIIEKDILFIDTPFSSPLNVNRAIYFKKDDSNNTAEIAAYINNTGS